MRVMSKDLQRHVKKPEKQTNLCFEPPLMDEEQILNLFDLFWFERGIFNKTPFSPTPKNPQGENQNHPFKNSPPEAMIQARRSMSEDLSSKLSFMSNSNSPESVLFSPKLQTILSSRDIAGTESPENRVQEIRARPKTESRKKIKGRRRRGPESRSLSELEFEELKGFMDLGFVFSEEDKDSSLASIIPGLNRLGKRDDEQEQEQEEEKESSGEKSSEISRPYLSEAWEAMEKEDELKKPLMKYWRFPALGNEIDMKHNLKWWAHAVASTVR